MTTTPGGAWDERYAEPGWAFGEAPNDFLREHAAALPVGRTLCLAEGEGRNAVFLAGLGHAVTGVDRSHVGLAKARGLAERHGVHLDLVQADLGTWSLGVGTWDAIVSIFAHVPGEVRPGLHRRVVEALRPGGMLLLEAYTPAQFGRGTGGPSEAARYMSLAGLRTELAGLTFESARELERPVIEGRYHTGMAHVVQLIARRTGA